MGMCLVGSRSQGRGAGSPRPYRRRGGLFLGMPVKSLRWSVLMMEYWEWNIDELGMLQVFVYHHRRQDDDGRSIGM